MKITRLFDLLEQNQKIFREQEVVLGGKNNGKWTHYTASQYASTVNSLSLGLLSLGVGKEDKVATIIYNCPEWNFFDMALMQIGAIQIPIYPTISEANYEYILKEAEVKFIVVSNQEILERINKILPGIPSLKGVYSIEKTDGISHWEEILSLADDSNKEKLNKIKSGITTHDTATIIYTSGTTGNPKGVMLSHSNFIYNFMGASNIISKNPVNKALSFLPLCHVYERMLNYMYQNMGISIYYCDSIDKLRDFMKEVHPEIFGAVPRVIEKTYDKLVRTGRGLKGIKKQLFFWALNLAHRYEFDGKNGWFYNLQLPIADKLVFSKWREAFGGNLDTIVSGGATLNPRLARTFWAAKIKIMEGYGLTETSPVIAVSTFEKGGVKFGTVGPVMENVELGFADDGEILTKGPCLMKGYYNQPEYTREVIDKEGWFHTGDIGELIDNKYLKITDRKKEIFKTSGGKYIAPQVVENRFKESPFIENAMIVGENKNFTTALIIPNFEHIESWCGVKGFEYTSPEEAIRDEKIINRIQREVNETNVHLDKIEQVKKFVLLPKTWSVEDGELSPTLKLRRKNILARYKKQVDGLYS
ncbi:MAG: long-chain fatty acid--CoA ligase [Bacteroidales bacterium]|nr:long-chain fatty acid--CoA ligase [Bacteroidales bacterium]MCF8403562.1 long-chain fatty acid--CoA ligase [Bacteroidales bacterium]